MNAVRTLTLAGALVLSIQAAEAQLLFGSRPGEAHYEGDDTKIIMQVGSDLLRNAADGESRSWSNPQTGHGGTITIIRTYQRSGMRCRDAQVRSSLGERTISYVLPVCQIADGTWKIAAR